MILAEGTGDSLPKVECGGGGDDEGKDLFEDSLEDALCVFKSGTQGKDSDILKENEHQLLFYVDLENENIVGKDEQQAKGDDSEGAQQSKHPVLLNQYPLCKFHSLFLLFAEEALPQVLSDELLLLVLQIFKLSNNPQMRIGYNSMGADCIANNLHFHIVYADKMFGEVTGANVFPIESSDKKLFFRTNLKHKSADEINMYNCGVRFGELPSYPVHTLILSPDINAEEDVSLEDAQEALSHAAGVVLNYLIDQNIPHNLLVADEGMTLYIIPRKFDLLIENVNFSTSFETLCGFVRYKIDQGYKSAKYDDWTKRVQTVSLKEAEFAQIKHDLVNKFLGEYDGEVIQL